MFSTEIKINGALIGYLYGHNTGETNEVGDHKYEWVYHSPFRGYEEGVTYHNRSQGIEELVKSIFNVINI